MKTSLLVVAVIYASVSLYLSITPMVLAAPITSGSDVEPHLGDLPPYSETALTSNPGLFRRVEPETYIPFPPDPLNQASLESRLQHLLALKRTIKGLSPREKEKMIPFLVNLSTKLAQKEQEKYDLRDQIYEALKYLTNEVLEGWMTSKVRREVVSLLMGSLKHSTPAENGFAELQQLQVLEGLGPRIELQDPELTQKARWYNLLKFFRGFQITLEIAKEQQFLYDKLAVDEALTAVIPLLKRKVPEGPKTELLSIIGSCLELIWQKEHSPPAPLTTIVNSHSDVAPSCHTGNHWPSSSTIPAQPQSSHPEHPPHGEQSLAETDMLRLLSKPEDFKNIKDLPETIKLVPYDACSRRVREWTFALALMENCVSGSDSSVGDQEKQLAMNTINRCLSILMWKIDWKVNRPASG